MPDSSGQPTAFEIAMSMPYPIRVAGIQAGATEYSADQQRKAQEAATAEKWQEYYTTMEAQKAAGAAGRGGLESLVNSYNTAFNAATAINSQHYQQMQDIVNQTTGQGRADIMSTFGAQGSQQMQNLSKLGMGNTTVGSSLQTGNLRQQSAALNTLADTQAQQKLGVIGQYGNIMQQNLPNQSAIQALIQSLTSGAGAYGTAAAGGALGGLTQGAGTGYQVATTPTTASTAPALTAASKE
jgi:hypothetical protein